MAYILRLHIGIDHDLTLDESILALHSVRLLHQANLIVLVDDAKPSAELLDPYVRLGTGSLWVDLIVNSDHSEVAEVMGMLGLTVSATPWLAGLPQRIRERWYRDGLLAEKSKRAYTELHSLGRIDVSEHRSKSATPRRTRRRGAQKQQTRDGSSR
jgi:hypothetical protein